MKSAAIVFSGGELRGFAQIGAMKAIESFLHKKKIKIKKVVGTSFGSTTATMVSIGYSATKMTNIAMKTGFKLTSIRDIKIRGPALLKGKRIQQYLKKYIGDKTFKDAIYDLNIASTDALTGKQYIFTKKGIISADGSKKIFDEKIKLADAIRASIAIPVFLAPKYMYDLVLIDGAFVNAIGLNLINPKEYDYVIAIDVSLANFNFITQKKFSKINMVRQTLSIMSRQFHFARLEKYQKNRNVIIIKPPVGNVYTKRKNEMKRIIKCGYDEAVKVLIKY